MEGLPNWQVYGVPAVMIIVAIVNWLKESFNLESKWAFPVSTLFGAVVGTLLWLAETYTWALTVTQIILGALLLGCQWPVQQHQDVRQAVPGKGPQHRGR